MRLDLTKFMNLTDTKNVPFVSVKSIGRLKFSIGVTDLIGERNRIESLLVNNKVIVFIFGKSIDPSSDGRDTLRTRGTRNGEKSCKPQLIEGGILPLETDPGTGKEYTEKKLTVGNGLIIDEDPTEEKYGKIVDDFSDLIVVIIDTNKGQLNSNIKVPEKEEEGK